MELGRGAGCSLGTQGLGMQYWSWDLGSSVNEEHSRQKEQQMLRPCGRPVQPSTESKGDRTTKRGGDKARRQLAGPCRSRSCYLRTLVPLKAVRQGRDKTQCIFWKIALTMTNEAVSSVLEGDGVVDEQEQKRKGLSGMSAVVQRAVGSSTVGAVQRWVVRFEISGMWSRGAARLSWERLGQ